MGVKSECGVCLTAGLGEAINVSFLKAVQSAHRIPHPRSTGADTSLHGRQSGSMHRNSSGSCHWWIRCKKHRQPEKRRGLCSCMLSTGEMVLSFKEYK